MKSLILLLVSMISLETWAAPAKILLTFDDGPNPASTRQVLNELDKRKAKAVFFILTGPEILFKKWPFARTYPKAETAEGFEIVVDEVRRGHLLACHWGGTYESQLNFHPPRLLKPAYDSTGDGVVDKISAQGNALESDLIQCQERLILALKEGQSEQTTIDYIRPPVWKYKKDGLDARPVYEALGMKMIMTDAKLTDGGYPIQGNPMPEQMALKTIKALRAGAQEVILTLHDSNTRTAKELSKTLDILEEALERKGLHRGVHWDYTQNLSEIESALKGFYHRQIIEP